MKPMESFLMLYFLLDACYCIFPEDGNSDAPSLGDFLSDCDPTLWSAGRPMDQAIYNDWLKQNDVSTLNNENIIDAVINFLKFYEARGFDFGRTKEFLRQWENPGMIRVAARRTEFMYQQHCYSD